MSKLPRRARSAAPVALVLSAALALFAAAGCSDDETTPIGPAPAYSSIVITGVDTVLVGEGVTFTAVVIDTGGQVVAAPLLDWTSGSTAIATVTDAGRVDGKSEGDAVIQAVGGGISSNTLSVAVIQGRGWVDQTAAVNTVLELNGVHFVNARTGWIVGDQGTILHTTDAGGTWVPQVSNSTGYTLNAVAFTSTSNGVIVGSAGRVLRTTNGGTTWTPLTIDSDGGKGLNDVFFQDATRGWIVGNGGLVLRSSNGGASWTRVLPGVTGFDLERVSFPRWTASGTPPADPYGRGWAVGAAGTILSTHDFGQSWSIVQPFVTGDPLSGVARRSTAEAIAVGSNNRVAVTAASADTATWSLAPSVTPFTNFTAVAWPATGSAWAVGKRNDSAQPVVLFSEDGGQSWAVQDLPSTTLLSGKGLNDVFFLDDRRGWAVGTAGLVFHTATGGR